MKKKRTPMAAQLTLTYLIKLIRICYNDNY
jgi:hypothetical protein